MQGMLEINSGIYAINKIKHLINRKHFLTLYHSLIYNYLDYGISPVNLSNQQTQRFCRKTVRIISGAKYSDYTDPLFSNIKILKLQDKYALQIANVCTI
jgi:hypothetical protein